MNKRCQHKWINLGIDLDLKGNHKGDWKWCYLCGATKHIVYDAEYYGCDYKGIYIRHIGKDEKAKLCRKW